MQDIECLALKLTSQLKSMKAIVEDRLHVEGNKSTSFKFNADEVTKHIWEHNLNDNLITVTLLQMSLAFIVLGPACFIFLRMLRN